MADTERRTTMPEPGETDAEATVTGGPARAGESLGETTLGSDTLGEPVETAPEFAGTVAGNTTAAGGIDFKARENAERETPADDLGPGGATVQELGGEARR